jgi:hypothetical protein
MLKASSAVTARLCRSSHLADSCTRLWLKLGLVSVVLRLSFINWAMVCTMKRVDFEQGHRYQLEIMTKTSRYQAIWLLWLLLQLIA